MTNYAFQSKEVAEALSRVGKQAMRGVPNVIAPTGAEHIYAKVPAEGIDGRSDTTCTSGVCTLVRFVTGELIEESGTNVEVYNVSETDLEPDAYIEVFRVGAFWVFDGSGASNLKHVKSPAAGITGTQSGTYGDGMHSATCTVRVQDSGTQVSASYIDKVPAETVDVWNPNPDKILGNVDFVAMYDGEFWFALLPSSSGLKQLTATSAITAASGLTFGTGTADILQINSGGTAYETAGLADVDIINPWEESIASGAMLTCYKEGAKYVIVQVSCPA